MAGKDFIESQLGVAGGRLAVVAVVPPAEGESRIRKSAGRTDIGESAPCSKMGRAQVRKRGVLLAICRLPGNFSSPFS